MEICNLQGAVIHTVPGDTLWDANLWGANLREANLRRADLEGANLHGADLRGAILPDGMRENLAFLDAAAGV